MPGVPAPPAAASCRQVKTIFLMRRLAAACAFPAAHIRHQFAEERYPKGERKRTPAPYEGDPHEVAPASASVACEELHEGRDEGAEIKEDMGISISALYTREPDLLLVVVVAAQGWMIIAIEPQSTGREGKMRIFNATSLSRVCCICKNGLTNLRRRREESNLRLPQCAKTLNAKGDNHCPRQL
ncbi:hypothetical protein K438DRAFT_1777361 [Mycena galopus ATCC 62051]|nr:hypothetical protein K438DRAFT_1777361 [Mycena galopus ATCC 62051]